MKQFKLIFIFGIAFVLGITLYVIFFTSNMTLFQSRPYMMHRMVNPISWTVYLPLIVFGVVFVSVMVVTKQTSQSHMSVLKQRLAEGDITIDEYNELKRHLS